MRKRLFLAGLVICACTSGSRQQAIPYAIGDKIYEASFNRADTVSWVIEAETPVDINSVVSDGALVLDVPAGITVWNTNRFQGDVMFEFDVTVVGQGGRNDRVSDLNCFWMATDPEFPDQFFERSSWRGGIFWNYYSLNLYYVGFGGHNNTKTRMRKYNAATPPPPPVLKEYDDPGRLISPNARHTVRILCLGSRVTYFFNGAVLFDFQDDHPYKEGHFGFRTTHNHMRIHRFTVHRVTTTTTKGTSDDR